MKKLQEKVYVSDLRSFCGSHKGFEERIRHLEYFAAMLIANNQTENVRMCVDAKEAVERYTQIAANEEDLRKIVDNHISDVVDTVLRLEDKINHHTAAIKSSADNVTTVSNDLNETKSRFELFVENADKVLETQRNVYVATNEHLVLLQAHMDGAKQYIDK